MKETIKERHEREINEFKGHYKNLLSATDWVFTGKNGGYLKFGSICDSSEFNEIRIAFVKKAINIFINNNKKEILNLASELVLEEMNIKVN